MELLSRFELESMSRGAGSAGARSDLGLKCASRKGMRSPVYLAIKKCSKTRKSRSIYGAAIQIRTGDLILTKDALYLLSYSSIS